MQLGIRTVGATLRPNTGVHISPDHVVYAAKPVQLATGSPEIDKIPPGEAYLGAAHQALTTNPEMLQQLGRDVFPDICLISLPDRENASVSIIPLELDSTQ